ncbi:hypothetical protein BE18_12820 [Sorangium cellulosum]|uniref:Uncharacterized protein n=1 Tax=Sorangium cellulosum TaxID=56 RepID=A0A150TH76_SORCE|nr:hypothetical protein BE18_12820 [Sorangium cellulosum]
MLREEGTDETRRWLGAWRLRTLLGYHDAAVALIRYLRDPERKKYIRDAGPEPVVGARVSLDWFRLGGRAPEPYQPVRWLGFCERTLRDASIDRSGVEATGEVFTRAEGRWFKLVWRKDDGRTPALVSASAEVPD